MSTRRKLKFADENLDAERGLKSSFTLEKGLKPQDSNGEKLNLKLDNLRKMYESLEASYRLLQSRKQICTYENLCQPLEKMTNKRFSLQHAAQLKAIHPEGIQLDYVFCSQFHKFNSGNGQSGQWQLQITLLCTNKHVNCKNSSFSVDCCDDLPTCRQNDIADCTKYRTSIFRSKLNQYALLHPQATEIPPAALPPLPTPSKKSQSNFENTSNAIPSTPSFDFSFHESDAFSTPTSKSRRKRSGSPSPLTEPRQSGMGSARRRLHLDDSPSTAEKEGENPVTPEIGLPRKKNLCLDSESESMGSKKKNNDDNNNRFIIDLDIPSSVKKLNFDEVGECKKGEQIMKLKASEREETRESDASILSKLSPELLRSVRKRQMWLEKENALESVKARQRRQLAVGLPRLMDMIIMIFAGMGKTVIGHIHLRSRLISSHVGQTNAVEVDEKLALLLDLAPDWLSAKPSLKGELLYKIAKEVNIRKVKERILAETELNV